MRSMQYPLPIIPNDPGSTLSTVLWWDNFDCNKETKEGSIHTCHGVAFQEEFEQTSCRDEAVEVVRSKKRTVSVLPHVLPRQKLRLTRNLVYSLVMLSSHMIAHLQSVYCCLKPITWYCKSASCFVICRVGDISIWKAVLHWHKNNIFTTYSQSHNVLNNSTVPERIFQSQKLPKLQI